MDEGAASLLDAEIASDKSAEWEEKIRKRLENKAKGLVRISNQHLSFVLLLL